jgi:hypothetical protein
VTLISETAALIPGKIPRLIVCQKLQICGFSADFTLQPYQFGAIMFSQLGPSTPETAFPATDPPVLGPFKSPLEVGMTFAPVMWTVWCALVVVMASLHIYRSSLARDEEDQIFLDDSFEHERSAQAAIVARVSKVEPILHVAQWMVVGMTVIVLAYYVRDILVHLNVIGS